VVGEDPFVPIKQIHLVTKSFEYRGLYYY